MNEVDLRDALQRLQVEGIAAVVRPVVQLGLPKEDSVIGLRGNPSDLVASRRRPGSGCENPSMG